MTLLDTLQDEMKTAMRSRDQVRLDALRLMVSAIRYVQVDNPSLDDAGMVSVLSKEAKKRREAIEAYKAAGRDAQAAQEEYELKLIEDYLPTQMSEDEVRELLTANSEQLIAAASFGEAMKIAMKAVGKGAEGAMVAKIVKELFHSEG